MRKAVVERATKETEVKVSINLDGSGNAKVQTPVRFFNHLIEALAKHGSFDLRVEADGDLPHHVVEDVMITLGMALEKALGDKRGIERMGEAIVPMDDALVVVSVDLSGRAYCDIRCRFRKKMLDDLDSDIFVHMLQSFSSTGKFNLHVDTWRGANDHHKAEAIFKALGIALRRATRRLPKRKIASTKGVL
jgi:imidazoleglycerol-phosphate dehydratase